MLTYFLEGVGYIVVGTFLIAALGDGGPSTGPLVWAVVGIAAVPSTLLWAGVARRIGWSRAIAVALAAQTIGTALPVFSTSMAATMAAAVLFGATFMGICMLVTESGQCSPGPDLPRR